MATPTPDEVRRYVRDHPKCKTSEIVEHFAGPPQDAVGARRTKDILLEMADRGEVSIDQEWRYTLKESRS